MADPILARALVGVTKCCGMRWYAISIETQSKCLHATPLCDLAPHTSKDFPRRSLNFCKQGKALKAVVGATTDSELRTVLGQFGDLRDSVQAHVGPEVDVIEVDRLKDSRSRSGFVTPPITGKSRLRSNDALMSDAEDQDLSDDDSLAFECTEHSCRRTFETENGMKTHFGIAHSSRNKKPKNSHIYYQAGVRDRQAGARDGLQTGV